MAIAGSAAIDVVIPTYQNLDELRACLGALAQSQQVAPRVLVCVDGSTDGTVEYLQGTTFPFRLEVVQHADRANHGRAATRNLALPHLGARVVLLLDSDMRLARDAIRNHLVLLEARECVSVGDVIYLNAHQNPWARYLGTRGRNKARPGDTIRPLDFVTANSAMQTECLLAVGGFDPTLRGYGGEDTDLAMRLARRGLPFVFNAAARAETIEPKTEAEGLRELRRYAATNLRTIRERYPDMAAPLWIDRVDSQRARDRMIRALLNPVTDRFVDTAMPLAPWPVKRRLLNYKVLRAVFAGYREAER